MNQQNRYFGKVKSVATLLLAVFFLSGCGNNSTKEHIALSESAHVDDIQSQLTQRLTQFEQSVRCKKLHVDGSWIIACGNAAQAGSTFSLFAIHKDKTGDVLLTTLNSRAEVLRQKPELASFEFSNKDINVDLYRIYDQIAAISSTQ